MNILLTGASGFMGRNFLLGAPADWRITAIYRNDETFPDFASALGNPNLTTVRCDLADREQAAAMRARHGREWDACLFLAAKVDIPWSTSHPLEDLAVNTAPLLNLLEEIQTRRLVYFSSGAVYDGLQGEVSPVADVAPTLPYAISKLACERYVEFFHRRRKSVENYLVVRFFGAFGPYEASHKIYTRLVRAFVLEGKKAYTIYGDGRNLIDAMYIDDAIDAVQRLVQGSHWNRTIDLTSGNPVSIETLVRQAAGALGVADVRIEKEGVSHEANTFQASTRDMTDLYGFRARVSLADGFRHLSAFLSAQKTKSPSA